MVVSLMDSGTSGLGSVVFLGKVMFSHSASLHPGELIDTVDFYLEVTLRWTSIPSRGGKGSRNTS